MRRVTPKLQQWLDRYNWLVADQLEKGFKPTATNAREGLANLTFALRIQSAGIYAQNLHFDDMIHAFLNMEDLAKETCATAYQAIGEFLNR